MRLDELKVVDLAFLGEQGRGGGCMQWGQGWVLASGCDSPGEHTLRSTWPRHAQPHPRPRRTNHNRIPADGCATPTIAVLYEDTKEQRHVRTYEVSLRDKVRYRGAVPWGVPGRLAAGAAHGLHGVCLQGLHACRSRVESAFCLKTLIVLPPACRPPHLLPRYDPPPARPAQELVDGPWRQSNLDAGACMLIPVPGTGGAVVVGESVVTFVSPGCVRSCAIKPTLVKASVWVGGCWVT